MTCWENKKVWLGVLREKGRPDLFVKYVAEYKDYPDLGIEETVEKLIEKYPEKLKK